MDLIAVQLLTLTALLVSCLGFSLLPLVLAWRASKPSSALSNILRPDVIGKVNCFVGGVFLATCFLHLLAETREDIEATFQRDRIVVEYPITELVACIGFFIVHLVETLTHRCLPHGHGHGHSPSQDVGGGQPSSNLVGEEGTTRPSARYGAIQLDKGTGNPSAQGTGSPNSPADLHDNAPSGGRNLQTLLLLIALTVHGTFEGVAIGVQTKQSALLWLFFVVALHKSFLALSLGMSVATGNLSLPLKVVTCVVFSLSGPVGQGIGLLVTDADGGGLATDILQGLATGTLLHVAFMEVLSKELKPGDLLGLLCSVIGFSILAGLTALPGS
ncbi:zinc transporter ZIP1-like [Branchiostoma floridae]|uniref:Zinc transporter ZIP3 n=1 Tax=Branchiostoma floridae TaxID=7739 RepID=A0A9J7KY60_BRAFL|nr:zinc transporter ZIP1-like [Branchiostoma floridae]